MGKNIIKDENKAISISILADSSIQFLSKFLKEKGLNKEFDFKIFSSPINQIEEQIFNQNSSYNNFKSDYTIIFESTFSLKKRFDQEVEKENFYIKEIHRIKSYLEFLELKNTKVVVFNFCEQNDYLYGNSSSINEKSFIFQLRKINFLLTEEFIKSKRTLLLDISSIQNLYGFNNLFESPLYYNYDFTFSVKAYSIISDKLIDIICSQESKIKKCLIFDLDNTIWGGIIGDDGIEKIKLGDLGIGKSYKDLQQWIRNLKNRGVILCVCSKNNESIAKDVFINHPDMILKLDDISVFMANWDSKVENINRIQKILNIGFDAMVFIDDNIFERNVVRENIPEITVPELPVDPANYLNFLTSNNYFEPLSFEENKIDRTRLYQQEQKRVDLKNKVTNIEEFMLGLGMVSVANELNEFNIPRVSQLSQRSNQFNFRTIRYKESELFKIKNNKNYLSLVFDLKDRFGDNGIVSFIILKKENKDQVFIENWAMSCRVFEKSLENFIINKVTSSLKKEKIKFLTAELIENKKNTILKGKLEELGFVFNLNFKLHVLNLEEFYPLKTFIKS